jgi:hypothetical protein
LVIACALPMTACNKSPEVSAKNASVAEVAQKVRESGVASDNFLHAGQWRVSSTVEEMTIPGMPPEAQAEMKKFMGQQNASYEYCLTPEEAKKPGGKFFTGKDERNCRYDHFTMSGGKFDAAMRCQGDASGAMTMAMNGTYSPDSYSTHVAMNMEGGREGKMSMKMRSEAKRVGECSAKRG